jgi:hypothetical protein
MALNDVTIIKQGGGLGRRNPSEDMVSGLLVHGWATPSLPLGAIATLFSVRDAEGLGLTRAYDAANEGLVHYHIREFFRMNPNGELHLMLVPTTVTDWSLLVDKDQQYAAKLLRTANGRIRQLGVAFNLYQNYTPVLSGGLDAQLPAVISKAQALADSEFVQKRPVDIVIEGRSYNGTASAAANLRALDAANVSVVIAQDRSPGSPFGDGLSPGHAALGTVLGTISAAQVQQNIGALALFNLTGNGAFLAAGLSSGQALASYSETDLGTLKDKGYLFALPYAGYAGHYWCDSATCTEAASDFAYIENNRTMHKASRLAYRALLPLLMSNVPVDADTGNLDKNWVAWAEALGLEALSQMYRDGELSALPDVYIDPAQNVLATSMIDVRFAITPLGVARQITGYIRFNNPFNNA